MLLATSQRISRTTNSLHVVVTKSGCLRGCTKVVEHRFSISQILVQSILEKRCVNGQLQKIRLFILVVMLWHNDRFAQPCIILFLRLSSSSLALFLLLFFFNLIRFLTLKNHTMSMMPYIKIFVCSILLHGWLSNAIAMPTDEASPMITAPVSPHDLNRALKRDSITCNNDICNSPSTCAGPIGNTAACCYPYVTLVQIESSD